MTTNLGYAGQAGQEITLDEMDKKPELIETLKEKKNSEVEYYDTFNNPGDNKGKVILRLFFSRWEDNFLSWLKNLQNLKKFCCKKSLLNAILCCYEFKYSKIRDRYISKLENDALISAVAQKYAINKKKSTILT